MADAEAIVAERIDQLLDEVDPRSASPEDFRSRQFDLGLAWVSFPEGWGGLGLPPRLQRDV
ncbi:MAG TPA: acyl-CoA dehydrogenase, partial [Acidimicrobiales bacterium]|nr:acyl-CoA dehydrogenase [Acidimicrobiales bacterium]